MPRLSKRIRKIASVPNQSHLDSEGFMCTETSLKFFFCIYPQERKKPGGWGNCQMLIHPCFLQMFPFCWKTNLQNQEPSKCLFIFIYFFLGKKTCKQLQWQHMMYMKAEVLCHLADSIPLTFPWPKAAELNWVFSCCLVPNLDFCWHGE